MDRLRWLDPAELDYFQEQVPVVSRRARRLLAALRGNLGEHPVDAVQLSRLLREVRRVVNNPSAASVISGELHALLGCVISRAEQSTLACSIAGSIACAKRLGEAGILTQDVGPVDCLGRIQRVVIEPGDTGESFTRLRVMVCNSSLAGSAIMLESLSRSGRRWGKLLGLLGPRYKPFGWHSNRQLIDAELVLRLTKQQGEFVVEGVSATNAVLSRNRLLAISRSREKSLCRFGALYDCGLCAVGRNQCELSCLSHDTEFDLFEGD